MTYFVSHFHVAYIYNKWLVGRVLCPMIILHKWPIVVNYMIGAKLWLISKSVSKGRANISLQCS